MALNQFTDVPWRDVTTKTVTSLSLCRYGMTRCCHKTSDIYAAHSTPFTGKPFSSMNTGMERSTRACCTNLSEFDTFCAPHRHACSFITHINHTHSTLIHSIQPGNIHHFAAEICLKYHLQVLNGPVFWIRPNFWRVRFEQRYGVRYMILI
jgi:hypothetical protein